MARIVALSGGVASGKSAVTDRLLALGVEVVDADEVSRDVVAPGTSGFAEVIAHFGAAVVKTDGALDRRALRERIFSDAGERHALEKIVHPRVRDTLRERALGTTADLIVLAIPLLVESGQYNWADWTAMVDVRTDIQRQRLMRRDQVDLKLATRMISAQAPRSARLAIADEVLVNDGTLAELSVKVDAAQIRWLAMSRTRIRKAADETAG